MQFKIADEGLELGFSLLNPLQNRFRIIIIHQHPEVIGLAMGAEAIAVASAPLIAAACQQYRICGTGGCPVGIATQDPELRKRLKVDAAAQRVANYFNVTFEELKTFARITGHDDIHDLTVDDLVTINREISEFTNIPHA